jgi:RNA polymerase sigma-70 factor, ECF subfamily
MPSYNRTDEELMSALQRGETWAMTALYDRYARLIYSLALRMLNDRSSAEEVVQEVFVKVWRRCGDFDAARGKFSSWLTGIAHHHTVDELRRRRARPTASVDEEALDGIADSATPPDEVAQTSYDRRRIVQALQEIPDDQRRCIELAYFEGYTQEEISERLGQTLGTVKTRIRLGMQKLKSLLVEEQI